MRPCEGGGSRVDLKEVVTIGPRLWGNCSGRGREWVRSKRPHLLHSCNSHDQQHVRHKKLRERKKELTTFPGVKLDRRQVEVSVVLQL